MSPTSKINSADIIPVGKEMKALVSSCSLFPRTDLNLCSLLLSQKLSAIAMLSFVDPSGKSLNLSGLRGSPVAGDFYKVIVIK